jgi:hypothetical protein
MMRLPAVLLVLALGLTLLMISGGDCLLGRMAATFHLGYVSGARLVTGALL